MRNQGKCKCKKLHELFIAAHRYLHFPHCSLYLLTYLTEPSRALQPKSTQGFPRIGLFVVQAISLGGCRPIDFLTLSQFFKFIRLKNKKN